MRSAGRILIVCLVLAACGGSAGDDPADTTSSTTEVLSSSQTTAVGDPGSVISTTTTVPAAPLVGLRLEYMTEDIPRPTAILPAPGDDYLYFVDQLGTIRVFDSADRNLPDRMINIREIVGANGIEQGLLGMAFHPDYEANGRFYLYYTDNAGSRTLAEYTVASHDPPIADPASARILFSRPQPTDEPRHYGGMLEFGPDGYLYASLGDGAAASVNGQDPNTIFGAILRIDVDSGDPYGIPPDNPFVGGGGAPEVWAYGLRNPWRFDIDPVSNHIYIGDVGQADLEEVNVVPLEGGGYNFGWDVLEGTRCFRQSGCDRTGLTEPVVEYDHSAGCSITGGVVYRGSLMPELQGHYFYSDWCTGLVRSFKYVDGRAVDQRDWTSDFAATGTTPQIQAWGVDSSGELYVGTHGGIIYRVKPVR